MPKMTASNTGELPPQVQVVQMAMAHQLSRFLHVLAKLDVADLMADGPKTAEELAGLTKTHAPSLYRFMRMFAGLGFFTEDEARRFSLTALGETLRSGVPGSMRGAVLIASGEMYSRSFDNLLYTLQTGERGFDKAFGMPVFDWLAQDAGRASQFSELMAGMHGKEVEAIAAAYDFPKAGTIVDVGGASGKLLATILKRHSGLKGILFDLPHVVRDAPPAFAAAGVTERVDIKGGSFFEAVPAGADFYIMSHIIHDWAEEECLTILANCRKAMKPDSRLLLAEMVLPDGNAPHVGKILDIVMMAIPGGQERTEAEYGALLAKAGFRMTRVVPTGTNQSIVEAVVG